jgi:hypothetical protein
MSALRTWCAVTALFAAAAAGAQTPAGHATVRDSAPPCPSCRFSESAKAYHRAADRVAGAWRTYYDAMAEYSTCMSTSLRNDAGRCGELPKQPAGSPCAAPTDKGIAICNATLPPDKPGATFVAIPDSLSNVDMGQAAFTGAGAVRYVWDAIKAGQQTSASPRRRARDSVAIVNRRHAADSLFTAIEAEVRPPPRDEAAYHDALNAGIARLNRAAISDEADEYIDALRFVAFADSLHPSPQAKFVMGLITYQIGEHALQAAWQIHNCSVVLLASDALVKSDRYLEQNSVVAPQNSIKLRESIVLMRKDATELVNRRCL